MICQKTTPKITLFYPCRSLTGQFKSWSDDNGERPSRISFERSLLGVRRLARLADLVVIDATEDPDQASDAFVQIVNLLGPESLVVYTEVMHEGLEYLVRRQGVPLLLGPLHVLDWDDWITHRFPRTLPFPTVEERELVQKPAGDSSTTPTFRFRSIAG